MFQEERLPACDAPGALIDERVFQPLRLHLDDLRRLFLQQAPGSQGGFGLALVVARAWFWKRRDALACAIGDLQGLVEEQTRGELARTVIEGALALVIEAQRWHDQVRKLFQRDVAMGSGVIERLLGCMFHLAMLDAL